MAKETYNERAKRLNSNKLITKRKTKPTVKSGLTGAKRTRKVDRPDLASSSAQITSAKLKKVSSMMNKHQITLRKAIDMVSPNATDKMKAEIAGMLGAATPFDSPKEFSLRHARYGNRPNTRKPGMANAKAMEASKKRKKPMALSKAANKKAATRNKKK